MHCCWWRRKKTQSRPVKILSQISPRLVKSCGQGCLRVSMVMGVHEWLESHRSMDQPSYTHMCIYKSPTTQLLSQPFLSTHLLHPLIPLHPPSHSCFLTLSSISTFLPNNRYTAMVSVKVSYDCFGLPLVDHSQPVQDQKVGYKSSKMVLPFRSISRESCFVREIVRNVCVWRVKPYMTKSLSIYIVV